MRRRELLWDDWNENHVARHGVSPDEVEDVCFGLHLGLRARGEGKSALFGQTSAGRYLLVIVAERGAGMFYAVTAREMTPTERRRFQACFRRGGDKAMAKPKPTKNLVPPFASVAEEASFWDTHSPLDYPEMWEHVAAESSGDAIGHLLAVRLDVQELKDLAALARQMGMGPAALARLWITERLRKHASSARAVPTPDAELPNG